MTIAVSYNKDLLLMIKTVRMKKCDIDSQGKSNELFQWSLRDK